jgi:uncharacterized protein
MQKRFLSTTFQVLCFVLLLGLASLTARSQNNSAPFSINESPLPAPTSPVMDYANVLDANTKRALEQRLIEFRDRTNPKVELAVAIVKTTGERPIFDYSLAVSRGWKIGSKEQDNPSALLFIAIDDRKAYVQVSKDLEDELPDGLTTSLQRQYLVPAFRQNNYGKGITDLMEAYIRTIESKGNGTDPAVGTTNQPKKKQGSLSICNIVICLLVLFVILLTIFSRFGSSKRNGRDDDDWRGGGFGGGGGTAAALPWIVGSILTSGSSGGSSSGGWGGSSGGGDSWGGFGGGGDFGGGGGGSDW